VMIDLVPFTRLPLTIVSTDAPGVTLD
jgi:hypothetical protein